MACAHVNGAQLAHTTAHTRHITIIRREPRPAYLGDRAISDCVCALHARCILHFGMPCAMIVQASHSLVSACMQYSDFVYPNALLLLRETEYNIHIIFRIYLA